MNMSKISHYLIVILYLYFAVIISTVYSFLNEKNYGPSIRIGETEYRHYPWCNENSNTIPQLGQTARLKATKKSKNQNMRLNALENLQNLNQGTTSDGMLQTIKQASQLFNKYKELQQRMNQKLCIGEETMFNTDDKVKVEFNATGEPNDINLSDSWRDLTKRELEKKILIAMKKAWKEANRYQREEYEKICSELNIPVTQAKSFFQNS